MDDPIAWVTGYFDGHCVIEPLDRAAVLPTGMVLYVAAKKWVGLTDEEIAVISVECGLVTPSDLYFARAIEAKLKEKNHGQ